MRKALLIYNPSSGRRRERRAQQVARALAVISSAGVAAESCATIAKGSAVAQTREAVAAGFDTVIACGGDGTANEILNGLMLAGGDAVLGVLPFGSGNVLATDLCVTGSAEAAARKLLGYRPHTLHPGLISYNDKDGQQRRYFLIAAGVGSDAELMYRTGIRAKERYGVYAYFLEMVRMTLHGRFPMFRVEWRDQQGCCHDSQVAMVMAFRTTRFPGLLQRVRLGAALVHNEYRVLLLETDKVRHFLNYFASVCSGLNWKVPHVDLVSSTWFRCTALDGQDPTSIHSEADGELLETLPVEVSIEPRPFKLLMPEQSS
jgi:diacylglycerol kinase (ATP)